MGGTYKDLEVWQVSMALVVEVYRAAESFPRKEMFGLTSQVRRAAVSVASNIAEGKGRFSDSRVGPVPRRRTWFSIRSRNTSGDCAEAGTSA